jgi:hypothetical protein
MREDRRSLAGLSAMWRCLRGSLLAHRVVRTERMRSIVRRSLKVIWVAPEIGRVEAGLSWPCVCLAPGTVAGNGRAPELTRPQSWT